MNPGDLLRFIEMLTGGDGNIIDKERVITNFSHQVSAGGKVLFIGKQPANSFRFEYAQTLREANAGN